MKDADINDAARAWLAEAFRKTGRTQTELAHALGVSPSAITRILKGERQISLQELDAALVFFGSEQRVLQFLLDRFPISSFLDGPEASLDLIKGAITGKMEGIDRHSLVDVPPDAIAEVDLGANLPAKTQLHSEAFYGNIYKKEVVRDLWKIPPHVNNIFSDNVSKNIRCFENKGDAMLPTIKDGDFVFIEIAQNDIGQAGLYALSDRNSGAIVRRCEPLPADTDVFPDIRVICDNKNYPDRVQNSAQMRVLGRVIANFSLIR